MALEACFQVSTMAHSTIAGKLSLPACKTPKIAAFSFSASASRLSADLHPRLRAPSKNTRAARVVCEAKNVVAEVLEANTNNWDSLVLKSKLVVLVDFWAPWCGPCRMIEPVIEQIAKDYAGQVICVKVNTDDSPNLANQFGIRSIPTVLIFKDGDKKETIVGAVPASTLTNSLTKYLG
uniref:Thioredoxin M-type n=1 Tax=Wolffia australiana TaxID=161112 RepID=H6UGY0_WOLAU|nr:thioredoxin M-type [Wolffia australiana]